MSGAISVDVTGENGGWVLAGSDEWYAPDVDAFRPGHPSVVRKYETACFWFCSVAIAPGGRTGFVVTKTEPGRVRLQIIRLPAS
jgi:hypothetical protein